MAVKSYDLGERQETRNTPPLNRRDLEKSGPYLRAILGVGLIAYSSISTIDGVRNDCGPLCAAAWQGIPIWIIAGVAVAAGLTLVQWLTSESWRFVYAVALLIDARYSQRWLDDWFVPVASHNVTDITLAIGAGLVLSWVGALAIAMFGEVLLFGRRR
jgi:hypothetical protein